jgi:hypothetical protein
MNVETLIKCLGACNPKAVVVLPQQGDSPEVRVLDEIQPGRLSRPRGVAHRGSFSGDADPDRRNAVCLLPADFDADHN